MVLEAQEIRKWQDIFGKITEEDLISKGWYKEYKGVWEHLDSSACLTKLQDDVYCVYAEVYDIGNLITRRDFYRFCESLRIK